MKNYFGLFLLFFMIFDATAVQFQNETKKTINSLVVKIPEAEFKKDFYYRLVGDAIFSVRELSPNMAIKAKLPALTTSDFYIDTKEGTRLSFKNVLIPLSNSLIRIWQSDDGYLMLVRKDGCSKVYSSKDVSVKDDMEEVD